MIEYTIGIMGSPYAPDDAFERRRGAGLSMPSSLCVPQVPIISVALVSLSIFFTELDAYMRMELFRFAAQVNLVSVRFHIRYSTLTYTTRRRGRQETSGQDFSQNLSPAWPPRTISKQGLTEEGVVFSPDTANT